MALLKLGLCMTGIRGYSEVRKSSSIHKTISRGHRASVACVMLAPGVVIAAVDGLLILDGVASGDCGLGLLATPLASVEPAVEDACCVSRSSRGVGNCKGGRSCLLDIGQLVQRIWDNR
jgi:hypothetical protein